MNFTEAYLDRCSKTGIVSRIGNEGALEELLRQGASTNQHDNRGWYPLHEAAFSNHAHCLELLLKAPDCPGVDIGCHDGKTALLIACSRGHVEAAQALLDNGADPNKGDTQNLRPLIEASSTKLEAESRSRFVALVELLLSRGADTSMRSWNGWSCLHEAAFSGSEDIVEILLKAGADPFNEETEDGITTLFIAVQAGNDKCAELLLASAENLTDNGGKKLANRCTHDETSPIYISAQEGKERCVEVLLKYKADPDVLTAEGVHPVAVAARNNHYRTLAILLSKSSIQAINDSVEDPLFTASERRHFESLKLLIEVGLPLERTSEYRFDLPNTLYRFLQPVLQKEFATPLAIAASKSFKEGVRLLLESGALPIYTGSDTLCPLILAIIRRSDPEILGYFLHKGPDVNFVTEDTVCGVPDALLMALHPIYRVKLIEMLKIGLKPRLDLWCSCNSDSSDHSMQDVDENEPQNDNYVLLDEIRGILVSEELYQLILLLINFSAKIPDCCNKWRNFLADENSGICAELSEIGRPASLKHLCRTAIRDTVAPKDLREETWVRKIPVPNFMYSYLRYSGI